MSHSEEVCKKAAHLEEQALKIDQILDDLVSKVDRVQHYGTREPQNEGNVDELKDEIAKLNKKVSMVSFTFWMFANV